MKPQEPIPHNYSMSTLNRIFALSSLGLLALTGALVMFDYARGWKRFQIDFLRLQRDRIEQELKAAEQQQNRAELTELDKKVREQEASIASQREEYREAQKNLDHWEGVHYASDQDYRFAKAVLDAQRYEAEVSAEKRSGGWQERQKRYEEQFTKVTQLKGRLEDVTKDRDAARARVAEFLKQIDEAEERKKELTASTSLLQKQLGRV